METPKQAVPNQHLADRIAGKVDEQGNNLESVNVNALPSDKGEETSGNDAETPSTNGDNKGDSEENA